MINKLFQAAQTNKYEEVKEILDFNTELVNYENDEGLTPLGYAAHFGNKDVVQILLQYGADVNAVSHSKIPYIPSNTALHAAIAGERNLDVIRLLLKSGARTNILDSNGQTCLHSAAFHNNSDEIIKLLIEHDAPLHVKDNEGKTAYDIAREQDNEQIAVLLSKHDK